MFVYIRDFSHCTYKTIPGAISFAQRDLETALEVLSRLLEMTSEPERITAEIIITVADELFWIVDLVTGSEEGGGMLVEVLSRTAVANSSALSQSDKAER